MHLFVLHEGGLAIADSFCAGKWAKRGSEWQTAAEITEHSGERKKNDSAFLFYLFPVLCNLSLFSTQSYDNNSLAHWMQSVGTFFHITAQLHTLESNCLCWKTHHFSQTVFQNICGQVMPSKLRMLPCNREMICKCRNTHHKNLWQHIHSMQWSHNVTSAFKLFFY